MTEFEKLVIGALTMVLRKVLYGKITDPRQVEEWTARCNAYIDGSRK